MIDLSIIIVNWNVQDLLRKCLETILSSPIAINETDGEKAIVEIIVIDSASSDDSVAMVQTEFPQVKLLPQAENVGFTRGNNIGFEIAQGRYFLMLNPDTEIIEDTLPQMIAYMDDNPQIGILGPHTLNTDGTTQSTRRHFPTKAIGFFESTWLQPFAPQPFLDYYYVSNQQDDDVFEVDWVQGSALMFRREVYEQIGGLDTEYVMYWEELDWCKRAKDAGFKVLYLGTAQIIHHGGKSSEQASAFKHIHFQQSKLRYFRKFHGLGFAHLLRLFLLLNYWWQFAIESAKSLVGHKKEMRQERIKVYRDVLQSGLRIT